MSMINRPACSLMTPAQEFKSTSRKVFPQLFVRSTWLSPSRTGRQSQIAWTVAIYNSNMTSYWSFDRGQRTVVYMSPFPYANSLLLFFASTDDMPWCFSD